MGDSDAFIMIGLRQNTYHQLQETQVNGWCAVEVEGICNSVLNGPATSRSKLSFLTHIQTLKQRIHGRFTREYSSPQSILVGVAGHRLYRPPATGIYRATYQSMGNEWIAGFQTKEGKRVFRGYCSLVDSAVPSSDEWYPPPP